MINALTYILAILTGTPAMPVPDPAAPTDDAVPDPAAADPASDPTAADAAATVAQMLQDLPISTHAVIAACFVGGVILAIFGRKSLRVAFTVAGTMLGLQAGLFLPAVLDLDVSNLIVAIIGGVLGALLGLILYRFSIVAIAALMGLLVVPTATAATFLLLPNPPLQGPPEPRPEFATETESTGTEGLELPPGMAPTNLDALEAARALSDEDLDDFADAIEDAVNALRPVVTATVDATSPYWDRLSRQQQLVTILSAVGGLFLGMFIGMFMTNTAAALITAGLGTALYLPTGLWLLAAAGTPAMESIPAHPALWLPIWLLLSAAAVVVARKPKAKAKPAGD